MKTGSLISLLTVACLMPVLAIAQVNYAISGNTAYVTSSPGVSGNIVIDSTYNGYPVTSIGSYAFYYRDTLTSVIIPNSVTNIEEFAFYGCSGLKNVAIPDSVTSIGPSAFSSCPGLVDVTIGNGVINIGAGALSSGTGLMNISVGAANPTYSGIDGVLFNKAQTTLIQFPAGRSGSYLIPNSVTNFQAAAFAGCLNLASVIIPGSVTSIAPYLFSSCSSLTNVTLPDSVTSIGSYAFQYCSSLSNVTLPNTVTNIGFCAFQYCSSLTGVTIPGSVGTIADGTFCGCNRLTSVMIPNSVSSIGWQAFIDCSSLTNMTIPNSVAIIERQAFYACTSLRSVTIGNSVTNIGDYAFSYCASLTNATIPNSVISIGTEAFSGCHSLPSVTIPNSVISIGSEAFSRCTSLTSILVAAANPTYSSIGGVLFNKAETILIQFPVGRGGVYVIPDSVTNIQMTAFGGFDGNTRLTSVTIPSSVTSIPTALFFGCTSLTNVTIPNTVTSIGSWAFSYCSSLSNVTIPNTVTSIGEYAFFSCTSLTSVTIPSGVSSLNEATFRSCTNLTTVTIPNSVTSIGYYAFIDCTSLTSVTIPNSTTNIATYAFGGCLSLTNISVGAANPTYSSIDGVWFNKAQTILIQFPGGRSGSYIIPNGVTNVAYEAFNNCPNVTSLTLPNSVTNFNFGWLNCKSLTNLTVAADHPVYSSMDGILFDKAQTTLIQFPTGREGSYVIPNSVTNIYSSAFYQCHLTSISLPAGVTDIWAPFFDRCNSLMNFFVDAANPNYSSVNGVLFDKAQTTLVRFPGGRSGSYVIPAGVGSIGFDAFGYSTSLASVTFPGSVTDINDYAFDWSINLTNLTFLGNAPFIWHYFDNVGAGATVYYYYGTTGWEQTYGGLPSIMRGAPAPQLNNGSAGVKAGGYGFTINGVINQTIVIEASTNLVNWQSIWTNTLSTVAIDFVDSQWLNHPRRFYRVR